MNEEQAQAAQAELDQIRAFQAKHPLKINQLVNRIRTTQDKDPESCRNYRAALAAQNNQAEKAIDRRGDLETQLKEYRARVADAERLKNGVRHLVSAMLSNPEFADCNWPDLVHDAHQIEALIQNLPLQEVCHR